MSSPSYRDLSRRERQIMDCIYALSRATALEVQEGIPDPPSYSAVRALLRILVDKGYLAHSKEGNKLVYVPTVERDVARETVLQSVVQTFFGGSASEAMAALLDMNGEKISPNELADLARRVEQVKNEGR